MTCRRVEHVIAVVDDEDIVRHGLERLVRAGGYAVKGYASGTEFLAALGNARPACVLLDLHMPELSGFEVLEVLKRQSEPVPIIVVTADCTPEIATGVLALGARFCLTKPVDAVVLLNAIAAAVSNV